MFFAIQYDNIFMNKGEIMLSDKALKNVQAVLASCDELIYGRFIFAENIIAKILQEISESEEIFDLIKECMKNFNFDKEFNRAKVKLPTKDGYFIMPESKAIILPLVFCILVDIRDRKLNFHDFLKNYFTSENIDEFQNFAESVMIPFKNAIMYCFDMEDYQTKDIEQKQSGQEIVEEVEKEINQNKVEPTFDEERLNVLFTDFELILDQIKEELKTDRHIKQTIKDDMFYLIGTMKDCCLAKDLKNMSAYIVAIEYIAKNAGNLIFLARELKSKLREFYIK